MPSYRTAPRSRPGPRRRSLLTGAAGVASAALLAGCSDSADSDTDGRPSEARRLRAAAAKDSRELLRRYDAVLAAHPSLDKRLGPLRGEVQRHVEAFEKSTDTESPSPTASGSPAGSTPKAPSPSAAPDPRAAVRDLAKAERELADRRGKALLDAPAEEGRLLASVAAAGAAHAYLLTETEDDK
ncbi:MULTISPECIES: hypothetical protein [Streptomyces]|uniref:Lipoprotein n=1 Tax=Streptomyces venezuelae TaxID=54571 RepID=A0A5P2BHE2_STRVZ|nr:hypothetical protein [Streptomyces venezuelae]MYZ12039.1 hypothetical protein [Streptomyces sp. SID337]NEA00788.1 hypothetical protein [Streptomyces sp. SID10116]NEB45463.1 hypothetical protein [Streptomyces sp. SID339]QES29796.1 hypothetical protein DEJ47_28120 [Streptomyces venezuelae]